VCVWKHLITQPSLAEHVARSACVTGRAKGLRARLLPSHTPEYPPLQEQPDRESLPAGDSELAGHALHPSYTSTSHRFNAFARFGTPMKRYLPAPTQADVTV
jgi:hypothetical protein